MAEDRRLFGITGDWSTAALDPGVWYSTVCEEGCRCMAAWVGEEKASVNRQSKREAEEADKVEVASGVAVASLRRFRAALIGPTQGLPKRLKKPETLRVRCCSCNNAIGCKCEIVAIRGGYRMARGWRCAKLSLSSALLRVARVLHVCAMHPFLCYGLPARLCTLHIFAGICFCISFFFRFCHISVCLFLCSG